MQWQMEWAEAEAKGTHELTYTFDREVPKETRDLLAGLLPAMQQFIAKQEDYRNGTGHIGDNFGAKGQYIKLYDKVAKLYGPLWEGKTMNFDDAHDLVRDIVGHLILLTSYMTEVQN